MRVCARRSSALSRRASAPPVSRGCERELGESLELSLGTTQKALGRLVDEGFLVRHQGHGTFVGTARRAVSGSWHYRFLAAEGLTELPVFTNVPECKLIMEADFAAPTLHSDGMANVVTCLRHRV